MRQCLSKMTPKWQIWWSLLRMPLWDHNIIHWKLYEVRCRILPPNQPETQGQPPLLFCNKCTGFFYAHYTTHGTNGFTSHPKDEAIMVKCLALRTLMSGRSNYKEFYEIAHGLYESFTHWLNQSNSTQYRDRFLNTILVCSLVIP